MGLTPLNARPREWSREIVFWLSRLAPLGSKHAAFAEGDPSSTVTVFDVCAHLAKRRGDALGGRDLRYIRGFGVVPEKASYEEYQDY
jgi:hypothetical protein